jgi:hypothetical protein
MSFITSQVTFNGIIMTADRAVLAHQIGASGKPEGPKAAKKRNNEKLFVTRNNIGISVYGAGSIGGYTNERHLYEFVNSLDIEKYKTPFEVAQQLRDYIRKIDQKMEIVFNVGGYDCTDPKKPVPKLWGIDIPNNTIDLINENDILSGSQLIGETEIVGDIMKHVGTYYKLYNVEDCIALAVFLTYSINRIKYFSGGTENVSEEMDILRIYPDRHEWLDRSGKVLQYRRP